MIKNKTRIRITWFCLFAGLGLAAYSIHKNMEGVAITAIGLITLVATAYIGGKTLNNQAQITNTKTP